MAVVGAVVVGAVVVGAVVVDVMDIADGLGTGVTTAVVAVTGPDMLFPQAMARSAGIMAEMMNLCDAIRPEPFQ